MNSHLDYTCNNQTFEAYISLPETNKKMPAVLICHAWNGRDDVMKNIADRIAELGYVAIALDVYGKGVQGGTKEQNMTLMQPLLDQRSVLHKRLEAGFDAVKALPYVDSTKIAAIGYCFGGLCALDLARLNVPLTGVISVHGLFNAFDYRSTIIKPKILALCGYLDPMVSHEDVRNFMKEMSEAKADWQLITYGNAMHAFTNPHANDKEFGTVYHEPTAARAWSAITQFLNECQK